MATPPAPVQPETGPSYPGGEDARAYRWAVHVFVLMFLFVICVGLLHYIGMFLKG